MHLGKEKNRIEENVLLSQKQKLLFSFRTIWQRFQHVSF